MESQKIKQLVGDFISLGCKFHIKPNFNFESMLNRMRNIYTESTFSCAVHPALIMKVLSCIISYTVPVRVTNLRFEKISEEESKIINAVCTNPITIVENSNLFKYGEFLFTVDARKLKALSNDEFSIFREYIENELWLPISCLTTSEQLDVTIDYMNLRKEIPDNMCVFYLVHNTLQFGVILSNQLIRDNSQVLIKNISPHLLNNYKLHEDVVHRIDGKDIYIEHLNLNVANSYNSFRNIINNPSYISSEAILDIQWLESAQYALSWAKDKCENLQNYSRIIEYLDLYKEFNYKVFKLKYFYNFHGLFEILPNSRNHEMLLDSYFYCIARPVLTDVELIDYEVCGESPPKFIIPIYMLSFQYDIVLKNSLPEHLKEIYGEW